MPLGIEIPLIQQMEGYKGILNMKNVQDGD
jgi:hypothetical protein